ncbi:MAG TPA: glycosyltransferase family 4 protein, partial [Gemmatimonadaceae bacterium]|nr:glycosyltransferase family 4 protein [Gemmatimonadaceae bacterium]
CTHHDIESDALRQRAGSRRSPLLARYISLQADRVERVERELCPRFAMNVVMSAVDAERLVARAPGAKTQVVPNGVDTEYFETQPLTAATPGRVTFTGGTYVYPNRDAVEHLLADIWPKIRDRAPNATLHLIGRHAAADQMRYEREPGVRALGHVDDIRPHVAEAACTVVPVRVGGGTRIKILDAWAMGRPVVSTSRGCEGLAAVDGENVLIRDAPDEFADAVVQVLADARLRAQLARCGRATVERHYSWQAIGQCMRAAYMQLVA